MKLSFDIDNTLIPYSNEFEVESNRSILNLFANEKLRVGTSHLFNKLQDKNHKIWIYTTSYRPIWKLKLIFAKYGLFPKGFINQKINQTTLKKNGINASKNPNLFDIDLHIDNSEGVGIEGDNLGFETLIIEPNNRNWVELVLNKVENHNLIKASTISKFQINDTFKITGRGIVLAGFILEGKLNIGDFIAFNFNGNNIRREITGIEEIRSERNNNCGLLIKSQDFQESEKLRNWKPDGTEGIITKQ